MERTHGRKPEGDSPVGNRITQRTERSVSQKGGKFGRAAVSPKGTVDQATVALKKASTFTFFGIKLNASYFGLCFIFGWFFGVQRISPAHIHETIQGFLYIGVAFSCILFALIAQRRKANVSSAKGFQLGFSVLITVCSFILIIPNPLLDIPFVVVILGLISGGIVGWQYMLWGSFYSKLDIKPAIAILFGTVTIAAVIKALTVLFHPHLINTIFYSFLPVMSIVCWRFARKDIPIAQFSSKRYNSQTLPALNSLAIGIVVFSFALGLLLTFDFDFFVLSTPYLIIAHALTIVVCVPFLVIAFYRKEDFDFASLWFALLLAIGTAIVFTEYPIAGFENLSLAIFTAAHMFVVVFLWLALSDISHNSAYLSDTIFGLGWTLYALPIGFGLFAVRGFLGNFDQFQFSLITLLILMVVLYLLMRERQSHDLKLFRDLNPPLSNDGLTQLSERIVQLSEACDLTEREKEIITLYAQGRSRSFISSKLYISENTVRDHIKRAYKKLQIHSKQELIDRIEKVA